MSERLAIPEQEYADRLARTQELMAEQGLDGLVVFAAHPERIGHVAYLTNHRPPASSTLSHQRWAMPPM